jgi:hypothetical protein
LYVQTHKDQYGAFSRLDVMVWHQISCMLYAGTAKLGSVQVVGSTTRQGSDFLNSATYRVLPDVMDEKLEKIVQEIIGLICREELNLIPAAGAVMVFVPEAVH